MAEDTHLDKYGTPLKEGDEVELFYGGDLHHATVHGLTQDLDVDHIKIRFLTPTTVPTGSVRFIRKGPLPSTGHPDEQTPQDPKTKPPASHRPTHRQARTTRRN